MEKKTLQNQSSIINTKWINTPFAFAQMSKDLTLMQQTVLLMISEKLQDFITKFYKSGRDKLPDDPNSLFPPEDKSNLPEIYINLSDFGLSIERNAELAAAITSMRMLGIKAPTTDKQGHPIWDYMPMFSSLKVPRYDETKDESAKHNKLVGYMRGELNPNVVDYVFNMTKGYINHPLKISADASMVYSPRLYHIIKHYLVRGRKKVVIDYRELREALGMNPRDINTDIRITPKSRQDSIDKKKEEVEANRKVKSSQEELDKQRATSERMIKNASVDDKGNLILYPQFSRFKSLVIEPVMQDFHRMAALNMIDIDIESYEPIYKRSVVHRGAPDAIEFTIRITELGKYHKDHKSLDANKVSVVEVEVKRKRGRPSKKKIVDIVETDLFGTEDHSADILSDIEFEMGCGQMGYEYYFGKTTTCRVDDTEVVISVKKNYLPTILNAMHVIDRINKCIAKYYTDKKLRFEEI